MLLHKNYKLEELHCFSSGLPGICPLGGALKLVTGVQCLRIFLSTTFENPLLQSTQELLQKMATLWQHGLISSPPPPHLKFLFHTIGFGPGTVQKRKPHIEIINSWKTIHRNEEIEKSCASWWKLTKWHFGSSIRSPAYHNTNQSPSSTQKKSLQVFSSAKRRNPCPHARMASTSYKKLLIGLDYDTSNGDINKLQAIQNFAGKYYD